MAWIGTSNQIFKVKRVNEWWKLALKSEEDTLEPAVIPHVKDVIIRVRIA